VARAEIRLWIDGNREKRGKQSTGLGLPRLLWTAKQTNAQLVPQLEAAAKAAGVPITIVDARKSSYDEDHGG
jgi:hypothetical protein